jgi:hypothetical protein
MWNVKSHSNVRYLLLPSFQTSFATGISTCARVNEIQEIFFPLWLCVVRLRDTRRPHGVSKHAV